MTCQMLPAQPVRTDNAVQRLTAKDKAGRAAGIELQRSNIGAIWVEPRRILMDSLELSETAVAVETDIRPRESQTGFWRRLDVETDNLAVIAFVPLDLADRVSGTTPGLDQARGDAELGEQPDRRSIGRLAAKKGPQPAVLVVVEQLLS